MESISELMQPFLSGGVIDTVSRFAGGSQQATKRTLESAVPTTMYAIADHGSTETGARSLIDGLRSGAAPSLDATDLEATLGDPKGSRDLMASSQGFLERLLGGKLSRIVDGLASTGGVGKGVASKILAVVAPMVLGTVGKRVRIENLDSRGLAGYLSAQKEGLAHLVPGPLRSIFGSGRVEEVGRGMERTVGSEVQHHERRKIWPWVLAALAALGLIAVLAGRGKKERDVQVSVPAQTEPKVTPESPAPPPPLPEERAEAPAPATPPAPAIPPASAPVPEEPEALEEEAPAAEPEKTEPSSDIAVVDELTDYFEGDTDEPKRIVLEGLEFDSGAATLAPEGRRMADELAALFKAHPDAKVRIEGFTDSSGSSDANQQLSEARADALKRHLIDSGLPADRIETVGRGASEPIATNEEPEGRAQNRRVEMEVERGT